MKIKVKCTGKVRNNKGIIQHYNLVSEDGRNFTATSAQIKEEMKQGRYDFINLQIDRAGRLVDKAEEQTVKKVVKQSEKIVKQVDPEQSIEQRAEEFQSILMKADENTKPLDIIKDYISKLNEIYRPEDEEAEDKFIRAYHGDNYENEEKMHKAVKYYFSTLVKELRKKAHRKYAMLYIPTSDEDIERIDEYMDEKLLPWNVIIMYKKKKCNYGILRALLHIAAEEKGMALIKVIESKDNGWQGKFEMLTANNEEAKKFLCNESSDYAYSRGRTIADCYDKEDLIVYANDLGLQFFIQYRLDLLEKAAQPKEDTEE